MHSDKVGLDIYAGVLSLLLAFLIMVQPLA